MTKLKQAALDYAKATDEQFLYAKDWSEVIEIFIAGAKWQRDEDAKATMDLYFALREIGGEPTRRDLIKLAKRIKEL